MVVAEVGIIGGSGLYQLPGFKRELTVQTPYGAASDVIMLGELSGRSCAFLPRHGRQHQLPPHRVPFRANLYALKELGVLQVIGCGAAGALTSECAVGDFVLPDQLVDLTHGREEDTFFDGPLTTHIGFSEPYCPAMREAAVRALAGLSLPLKANATVAVTRGPRFSTRAESACYAGQGWQLENMTQYPEAALARELTLSYLGLILVTNSHVAPRETGQGELASAPEVIALLRQRAEQLVAVITAVVGELGPGADRPAFIRDALKNARFI